MLLLFFTLFLATASPLHVPPLPTDLLLFFAMSANAEAIALLGFTWAF
jgi:hypothetical protein